MNRTTVISVLCLAIASTALTAQSPNQAVAPGSEVHDETTVGNEANPRPASQGKAKTRTKSRTTGKRTHAVKLSRPANIQPVEFTTNDGFVIAADFVEPMANKETKAPIAVLLHMYKSDRSTYTPLIGPLNKAGFAILAIDMRGHGHSVGPPEKQLAQRVERRDHKLFREMYKDVEAGYLWLRQQGRVDLSRLVIVGASVGCSVAMDYASRDPSVDAIVCMTAGTAYLGIDSLTHVAKLGQRPLLLLASEEERSASDQLAKLARQATVKIFPEKKALGPMGLHGTRMFGKANGVEKMIVDFLVDSVGEPSSQCVVASVKGKVYYEPGSSQASRLSQDNLRWFSSSAEADARGYRPPKSKSRSKTKNASKANSHSDPTGEPFPVGN